MIYNIIVYLTKIVYYYYNIVIGDIINRAFTI